MKTLINKAIIVFVFLQLLQVSGSYSFGQNTHEHYDLWVFQGSNELVMLEAKKFEIAHPEIEYQIRFWAPNFIFIVGLCGSKVEVDELKKILIIEYPDAVINKCQRVEKN
jgi:hypothetical protein